ncbi:MAG: hypothetical protein KDJ39_05860 [Gammaproteobacteria bacterium]|nr:hypothetical protein [Gammaproteobacteria bacterium]
MAREKRLQIGDKEVTIRELSAAEIRDWMANAESRANESTKMVDLADLLFEDVTFHDLTVMTNVTLDQLYLMAPSELREIADGCREINSHFFNMADRLKPVMDAVAQAMTSASSSEKSAA